MYFKVEDFQELSINYKNES